MDAGDLRVCEYRRTCFGKDVLLYGQIPALVLLFADACGIQSWPDLDSYQIAQLEEDMHKMQERDGYGCDLSSGDKC